MSEIASRRDNSDRSLARSAWESVPRKNRPVGYGMIGRSESQRYFSSKCAPCFGFSFPVRNFVTPIIQSVRTLHESDRTLRDGSFGWRGPRHFVPGYDRTVPPGRGLAGAPQEQAVGGLPTLSSNRPSGEKDALMTGCINSSVLKTFLDVENIVLLPVGN